MKETLSSVPSTEWDESLRWVKYRVLSKYLNDVKRREIKSCPVT